MSASVKEIAEALQELERRKRENKLAYYVPYDPQAEFHDAGKLHRERLFAAGNQLGKTYAAAYEAARHATGRYPKDWKGRKFTKPVRVWVASTTGKTVRDNAQRLLLGLPTEHGTGSLPKDALRDVRMARGTADAVDTILVKHPEGTSTIIFKSYEEGPVKFESDTIHLVWLDEEPDLSIYSACLARISTTRGMIMLTATPLLGMSNVMRRFFQEPSPDRYMVRMEISQAKHIPEDERQRIIDAYPEHEREARTRGIPMLGSGRVYQISEGEVKTKAIKIPSHWPRICGLDIGFTHPTCAAWLAWDRDTDIVYLYDCYKLSGETPIVHASALRARGKYIPVAWPNDAAASKDGNAPVADIYRREGVNMLPERAQFSDGGVSVEAGLIEITQRMKTGRFKVFEHLEDWFAEFRTYHRKEGRIVKEFDDLMDATRYAVMMLRNAKTATHDSDHRRKVDEYNKRMRAHII